MEELSSLEKKVKEGFIGQRMIVLPPNLKSAVSKNNLTRGLYLTAIGFYPTHLFTIERERKAAINTFFYIVWRAEVI